MPKEDVHDYLVRGIYGDKELKPEEKIRFLGEFRERVIVALKQVQVRKKHVYPQIENAMRFHSNVTLLLNGEMEYEALSKYIKLANEHKIPYRKVYDNQNDTDIGLLVASDKAVENEEIFIDDEPKSPPPPKEQEVKQSGSVASFFKNLFNR